MATEYTLIYSCSAVGNCCWADCINKINNEEFRVTHNNRSDINTIIIDGPLSWNNLEKRNEVRDFIEKRAKQLLISKSNPKLSETEQSIMDEEYAKVYVNQKPIEIFIIAPGKLHDDKCTVKMQCSIEFDPRMGSDWESLLDYMMGIRFNTLANIIGLQITSPLKKK